VFSVIEIVGSSGFIGSKIPTPRWSDRSAEIYLRWHGTDKKGRENRALQVSNVTQLQKHVGLLSKLGIQRFVGVGSWAEQDGRTPYGNCKKMARIIAKKRCKLDGVSFVWPQLFTVYGPGDKAENLIPTVISRLMAGEKVELDSCLKPWDFLYVDDAAQTLVDICRGRLEGVLQVVSGEETTVRGVIETIQQMLGVPTDQVVFSSDDRRRPTFSSYLQNVVSCVSPTPLREGLKRTIEWIREH
jgi:nucleoside-diphosphate-sugar epimerase